MALLVELNHKGDAVLPPVLLPPASAPPLPPPLAPLTARAHDDFKWYHDVATAHAMKLRLALPRRLAAAATRASANENRRALLVAIGAPPANAVAFRATMDNIEADLYLDEDLNLLRLEVKKLIYTDEQAADNPDDSLNPATLARDQLRLYLLEAEAATLAAWLAASPTP